MSNYILNINNWQPQDNHQVKIIDQIVETIDFKGKYIFGRPRKYDLRSPFEINLICLL
ncbi:hypothetical protein [Apilactobacillus micheneri]|uniref:hypothetical protein n=1 Tax=Apilactobacillus micheneri TaxID=1899430 RepID=UPI0015E845E7|nr:hypothetical protein [Apilactobacillus micheneri]